MADSLFTASESETLESPHLTIEILRALVAGALSGEELTRAEWHLESCRDCQDKLSVVANEMPSSADEFQLAATASSDGKPELVRRIREQADRIHQPTVTAPEESADFDCSLIYVGPTLKGGLGEVSVYRDTRLTRRVALKSLRRDRPASADRVFRFRREYEVTSRLQHPGIPAVYGKGELPDGREFYVMQFIQGATLQRKIEALHESGRPVLKRGAPDFRTIIEQFIDVCDTLRVSHKQGVLHRDLKPENIIIDENGRAVVLDWGLAGFADRSEESVSGTTNSADDAARGDESDDALRLTSAKQSMGTIAWMSPEQAAGHTSEYDQQTDVYGLGAILFHILTGVAPHSDAAGSWQSTPADPEEDSKQKSLRVLDRLRQIANGRHPKVMHPRGAKIPAELISICRAAIHPDKSQRLNSARAIADEVRAWLTTSAVSSHRYTAAERWSRLLAKYPAVILLSVAILMLVMAVLWIMSGNRNRELQAELNGKAKAIAATSTRLSGLYDDLEQRVQTLYRDLPKEQRLPGVSSPAEQAEQSSGTDERDNVPPPERLDPRIANGEFLLRALDIVGEASDRASARNAIEQARLHVYLAGIQMFEYRNWDAAADRYDAAFAEIDDAIAAGPNSRDLSSLLLARTGLENGMCLLRLRQGNADQAEKWLRKGESTLAEFRKHRPAGDINIIRETVSILERRAELQIAKGLRAQATDALLEACRLLPAEDVVRWRSQDLYDKAWILRQDLIINLRESDRFEEAAEYVTELRAIQAGSPRRGKASDSLVHRLDECRIDKLDADVRFARGDVDGAVTLLQSTINPLNALMKADPDNSEPRYLLSTVENKLRLILLDGDRPDEALTRICDGMRN
ncbi:MAG: protein kinase [Planctomycetaceae bacterium]